MKKKSIMGIEYKWEVLLVYLISILGFIFSLMKDKEVDKDVKFQYNQSGTIFIINLAINIVSQIFTRGLNLWFVSLALGVIQIVIGVFALVTVIKAFSNETYRIPVIADLSEKIFK